MKLDIKHQDSYSKSELLLRTFLGIFYILTPHLFVNMFVIIWSKLLSFFAYFNVLFTGRYPEEWFNFQVKYIYWRIRLNAVLFNLIDEYPSIGPNGQSSKVKLEIKYPEKLNQWMVILRSIFGFIYVLLPHYICLYFRYMIFFIMSIISWFVVLFTGKYPAEWHDFQVGTFRWYYRIVLYMNFMTDKYPKFSGKA